MYASCVFISIVTTAVACALLRAFDLARSSRLQLDEVIEALAGGFVMWDVQDRLVSCNRAFLDIYPHCADVLIPGTPFEVVIRHGVERGQFPEADGREEEFVREIVALHRVGRQSAERLLPDGRWILIHEERTRSGNIVAIRSDITAFKRALAEAAEARDVVQHMAHHDALTGLPNRLLFRERLDAALASRSASNMQIAVLYLDLDHFKDVNDRLGHAAGDELLACVSARIRAEVRPFDTAARLGGDEFAVLLTGWDIATEAEAIAGRVIAAVSAPFQLSAGIVRVGTSIGGSLCQDGEQHHDLVRRADEALYAAKRAGRGTFRFAPERTPQVTNRAA